MEEEINPSPINLIWALEDHDLVFAMDIDRHHRVTTSKGDRWCARVGAWPLSGSNGLGVSSRCWAARRGSYAHGCLLASVEEKLHFGISNLLFGYPLVFLGNPMFIFGSTHYLDFLNWVDWVEHWLTQTRPTCIMSVAIVQNHWGICICVTLESKFDRVLCN